MRTHAPQTLGMGKRPIAMGRRAFLATGLGLALAPAGPARAESVVRLGTLQFGTVQWVADVIRRNGLDAAHGVALQTTTLANTDAGRVALMAGSADVVVSDWLFAAVQRAAGTPLCFAPFSNATGGILARADSPVRGLADLEGRRLGVAGGPVDKSWLLVQAAAREQGTDLAERARIAYGAPPLLSAKLLQGELDAVLTFWNFAARLEAAGCRPVVSVQACAESLGLPPALGLVGYVFRQDWAERQRPAIDGFLTAAAGADRLLARSDPEWRTIRPLMDAPDDPSFEILKQRYRAGIPRVTAAEEQETVARLFDILLRTGGTRATGGLERLPDGIFWPVPDAET
jgi:NitT/TauT family transport system substrate-binding protein